MTTDLLERDDDLDRRLRAAMTTIATGYRPQAEPIGGGGRCKRRERRSRWIGVAVAAAVAVLGITGVWALNRNASGPAATATTEVVLPASGFGDDFTVPEVGPPGVGVRLDADIVDSDLPVENPYRLWMTAAGPYHVRRWFVATSAERVVGWVGYTDDPRSFAPDIDQLAPFDGAVETDVDLRQTADGDVLWRHGDAIRRVAVGGATVDLADAVESALAVEDLSALAVPSGHTDLSDVAFGTWQHSDWSEGTFTAPDEELAALYVSTWELEGDTRRIDDGLIIASSVDDVPSSAVVRNGVHVARITPAEGTTDDELERAAASLEFVPAEQLPSIPLFTLSGTQPIERDEPVAGGEIADGRWLAVDVTRPADAAEGLHCLHFLGIVDGFRGCAESGAALDICRHVDGDAQRLVFVTTDTVDPSALAVTADGEPLAPVVEPSGGLTFVTVTG